jgi:hypothetical protein
LLDFAFDRSRIEGPSKSRSVMEKLIQYKKKVASRYIPLGIEAVGLKMLESDAMFLSVKQDGHLAFLVSDGKSCALYNASGTALKEVPLLKEAAEKLKSKACTIAGELYVQADQRTYGFEVPSALAKSPEKLAFAAFDVLDSDTVAADASWEAKFEALEKWLGRDGAAHAVPHQKVDSRSAIAPFFNDHVSVAGAEGIVVRHESGPTYKIKPNIDLDMVVLGYSEGFDEAAGGVRELLVGLAMSDGAFQVIGQVGNGLTQAQRVELFASLSKAHAESDYLEVSGKNVAFTMVPPEHVVQIRCIDILSESSKGPVRKALLQWKGDWYEHAGQSSAVSLISPVFEGLRSDKSAVAADAGFTQIERWLSKDQNDSDAQATASSSVLRREVFVKESKGVKSVRKFLAWKTNKEASGEWPAYVFMYADYSPTRKDPLKKSLAIANSEDEVMALFDTEVADKIKRGWAPA